MTGVRQVSSAFWAALQLDDVQVTELIELAANGASFKWTSCNVPVVSSGSVYTPFPGTAVNGLEESTDLGVGNFDFVAANTGSILGNLLLANALDLADLVISRVITTTPDLSRMEIFRGKLAEYVWTRNQITGKARNLFAGISIDWPYYTYEDICQWRFGSPGCGFNTASITITGTPNVGASSQITLKCNSGFLTGSYSNDYMTRGRLTWTAGVNSGQVRTIRAHSGDALDLSHSLSFAVTSGDAFKLFPGCRKRLLEDCTSKWNNSKQFLGWPWIPLQENAF